MELLDDAVADVAQPADDHVVVQAAGDVGAEDAGQPGADQRVGDQREQDGQGGGARQHQGDAVQLQRGGASRRWMSPKPVVVMIVTVK